MRVSVLTPAIPERLAMLTETIRSVNEQILAPIEHLIRVDHERLGCAETQNRLLLACRGDWLCLLADDDILYPDHLATLASETTGADIVYSWCDVEGRPGWNPSRLFDADSLRQYNYIPSTCLIRAGLAYDLGGWRTNSAYGWEDWDFWLRALEGGAVFHCIPKVTWSYRFHGRNATLGGTYGRSV